jgi:hypothetical protein
MAMRIMSVVIYVVVQTETNISGNETLVAPATTYWVISMEYFRVGDVQFEHKEHNTWSIQFECM